MLCVRDGMRWAVATALTLAISPSAYAQQDQVLPGVQMVELDGRAVRVQTIGLQNRSPGAPVIVFEAGAANSLEIWGGLLPRVASMAPVVAYDRAGLGRSEWDGTNPTPRHVADRLGRMLQQIGANPPFVLVGFSWGGHARPLLRRLLPSRRDRPRACRSKSHGDGVTGRQPVAVRDYRRWACWLRGVLGELLCGPPCIG